MGVVMDAATARNYLPTPIVCGEGGAGPRIVCCYPSTGDSQWTAAGASDSVFGLVGGRGTGRPGLVKGMGELLIQRVLFIPNYHLRGGGGAFLPAGGLGLAGEQVHSVIGEAGGAAHLLSDEGKVTAQAGHTPSIPGFELAEVFHSEITVFEVGVLPSLFLNSRELL